MGEIFISAMKKGEPLDSSELFQMIFKQDEDINSNFCRYLNMLIISLIKVI